VIAARPRDGGDEFNRLVFERSPYLLQHARNPVDWYPWGEEAFRAAAQRDVPIFLSIGYSTCHWCHVMEHESFEDPEVAALMNGAFVCIKVDREERPDLDHIYMAITQAMNQGQGGWPMTVIMTPDKKPFFAGTYFPKHQRFGRLGMVELIPRLVRIWQEERDKAVDVAERAAAQMASMAVGSPGAAPGVEVLDAAFRVFAQRADRKRGGFGDRPKFPVPHELRFLLRYHRRSGEADALEMVTRTLREMRKGGLWDHVGFGFHRYSTDWDWLVPHFEKMLYDQALLAMAYLEGWQVTGEPDCAQTVREILTYVTRDMTAPSGGFYSAEDADSEGEEGLFYLWTAAQIRAALSEEDAELALQVFGVDEGGNFAEEATGQRTGRNILHLERTYAELAAARGEDPAAFAQRLEAIRATLFEVREPREHPLKDDKILTDWNGLAIAAFAQAARVLDEPEFADAARRAGEHLLGTLRDDAGRLHKLARLGEVSGQGMLEDYAFAVWGLLELFETTQEVRWLAAARDLTETMIAQFHDDERGGFFLSPADGEELFVRPKELYDGAIPSGNSVALLNLLRLGRLTGETRYEELAQRTLAAFAGDLGRGGAGHTQCLMALDFALGPTQEVVVVGEREAADTCALLSAIHGTFAPNKVVVLRPAGGDAELEQLVPYVAAHEMGDAATAYVCENFTCQAPTTDPDAVRAALSAAKRTD